MCWVIRRWGSEYQVGYFDGRSTHFYAIYTFESLREAENKVNCLNGGQCYLKDGKV